MSRLRLMIVLAGLYLAQSIPSYLIAMAIPVVLREQGVSRTSIGLIAVLMLPLVLKFLWAPYIDRWRPFARAHRAGWVFLTQAGIVAAIAGLAFIQPTDIPAFMTLGMIISVLLSTQDIATDGYATKALAARDRAAGNAIQGGSVALGVVIGGTGSLVVYHHFGWQAMIGFVTLLSCLPLIAATQMREAPAGRDAGPRPSLRSFLARADARHVLGVALVYRASEGLVKAMEGPYLVDRGLPLDAIGYLSGGAATTAGLIGSGVAALLTQKLGVARVLALLGGLRTLCFLLFALHAADVLVGLPPLIGAAAFQTLIRYMEIVALYSLFMTVASSDQPGTDFTILSCAQLVVYLAGSSVAGIMADRLGYPALFFIACGLSAVAVLGTSRWLRQREIASAPGG